MLLCLRFLKRENRRLPFSFFTYFMKEKRGGVGGVHSSQSKTTNRKSRRGKKEQMHKTCRLNCDVHLRGRRELKYDE